MDFTEDNKKIKKARRYHYWSNRLVDGPDEEGFLSNIWTVLSFLGYLVAGFFLMALFSLGFLGLVVCTVAVFLFVMALKLILSKVFDIREKKLLESLKNKYIPIRNKYIEETASRIGCTSTNADTLDITKKEWHLPTADGFVLGKHDGPEYAYTSQDNYGDMIIKSIPEDADVLKTMEMEDSYKKEGYTLLDVGVSEFNNRYKVFTKDPVKARTYFSATMIQTFINLVTPIDYRILGNNICIGFENSGIISPEFDFINHDLEYYVEQVDSFFNGMAALKGGIGDNYSFLFK